MTVIYTKSASFSGHTPEQDVVDTSPAASPTIAYTPLSVVVPNECMEAGVGLRKSPVTPLHEFEPLPEQPTEEYTASLTGDLEHPDNYVYRRPFVDRAFLHSQKRSQLIFDQKLNQRRLPRATQEPLGKRSRRPDSASYRPGTAPVVSDTTASAYLDVAAPSPSSPASSRLRALSTGPSAQPASKRASWIRHSAAFSDSTSASHASVLFATPPVSRPQSTIRDDLFSPITPSASMTHDDTHRHSTMSTNSSSSSPSKEGGSAENSEYVRVNGDAVKHEAEPSTDTDMARQDSTGVPDMFTTPRSSSEAEKAKETQFGPDHPRPNNGHTDTAPEKEQVEAVVSDAKEVQPVPALSSATVYTSVMPATPPAVISSSSSNAVSPSSSPSYGFRALLPEKSPRRLSDLSNSAMARSNSTPLGTLAVPRRRSSAGGPSAGAAAGVEARRGSSTSLLSTTSSTTSTYRVRRKPVPSEGDDGERRASVSSERRGSTASAGPGERRGSQSALSDDVHDPSSPVTHRRPSSSDAVAKASALSRVKAADDLDERPHTAPDAVPPSTSLKPSLSSRALNGDSAVIPASSSRLSSRATIKRPSTTGPGSQPRPSNAGRIPLLEVEGQQFVIGKDDETKPKASEKAFPNSVRFLRQDGSETSATKREVPTSPRRKSIGSHVRSNSGEAKPAKATSGASWDLQKELEIVERVRHNAGSAATGAGRSASLDVPRSDGTKKSTMLDRLDLIDEEDTENVKAAAREANIPEGSYAIHPPSMLQLFEASQCIVYDEDGAEVMLGDLFKKKRTLVCFLRHWWCGFCQQFAMSVRHIDPLPLKRANMDFIIIGQGDYSVIKAYREVMQVQYPMYADPKRNVYRALGMTLRTNDANPACARPDYATMSMTKGILVAIKKGLFDMPIRSPGDMKLLGGDFILGPGLQCSFTHRMTTADGHMDLPRILAQAGCDMSLKTPKALVPVDEKEERMAKLAEGNRHQTRSLGRAKSKSVARLDLVADSKSVNGDASMSESFAPTTPGRSRPSIFGRFGGRSNKSQVSLPNNSSMADVSTSTDFRSWRGAPRSPGASRKKSFDSRMRDSFESRQTEIEFESRATSIDTRNGEYRAPIHKTKSLAELRKSFTDTFRSKSRNASSSSAAASRISLDSKQHPVPPLPLAKDINLLHPITASMRSPTTSIPLSPRTQHPSGNNTPKGGASMSRASSKGTSSMPGAPPARDADASRISAREEAKGPSGSFLMDLDVYEPLSRQPASRLGVDHGIQVPLSPGMKSDLGLDDEAADADSDTEPTMPGESGTSTPRRGTASPNNAASPANGITSTSNSMATFHSFNSNRGKTNLQNLAEADEGTDSAADESFDEIDEPIEFDSILRH